MNLDDYIDLQETSKIIPRHPDTLRRWCKTGKLQGAQWFMGQWMVPKETAVNVAAITPTRTEQNRQNGRKVAAKQKRKGKIPNANKATIKAIGKRQDAHEALMERLKAMREKR